MKIPDPRQLLTVNETSRMLSVSRATLYRMLQDDPSFPRPVKLTQKSTRWRYDQICLFINQKSSASVDSP